MQIKSAELKVMATRRSQYPTDHKPEFLLVGRSNVGKSSFINTILEQDMVMPKLVKKQEKNLEK